MTVIEDSICWTLEDIPEKYCRDFGSVAYAFGNLEGGRDICDTVCFSGGQNTRKKYKVAIFHPSINNVIASSDGKEVRVDRIIPDSPNCPFPYLFVLYCDAKMKSIDVMLYGKTMADDVSFTICTLFKNDETGYKNEFNQCLQKQQEMNETETPVFEISSGETMIQVIYQWLDHAKEIKIELSKNVKGLLIPLETSTAEDKQTNIQKYLDLAFGTYLVCVSQYNSAGKLIYKSTLKPVAIERRR